MWEYLVQQPVGAFFMLAVVCIMICSLWRLAVRHLNIRKAGWPPEHCDADGDFRSTSDECEDER